MAEDELPTHLPRQFQPINHRILPRQTTQSLPNDFSIFPPINHENLHMASSHHNPEQQDPSPSPLPFPPPSLLSSTSAAADSPVQAPNRWFAIGIELLRSKMYRFVSSLEVVVGWASWFVFPGVGFAGVVILWWWLSRRRRYRRDFKDDWMLVIKEKDKKIMQLLHQIAQMNEVLLARHRLLTSKPGD